MAIKQLRTGQGLTQQQLADAAGIHVSLIRRYELGERDIAGASARTVMAIARALGTTVEELIKQPGE